MKEYVPYAVGVIVTIIFMVVNRIANRETEPLDVAEVPKPTIPIWHEDATMDSYPRDKDYIYTFVVVLPNGDSMRKERVALKDPSRVEHIGLDGDWTTGTYPNRSWWLD